ncbi:hypothetical protein [Halotia branconii]|uniref:Uncharacterized protein n=1 Tax=Halotia branconii CENA392 TaxID=1539056 RepID=A0AAJ6NXN8_9CYAN|nr:hypothetical protein [Halotia branconii]WGV28660.1 hypothetical protein QI031_14865 [Halotia branconii CENA392]
MGRWTPLILMAGGLAILLGTLLGINFPMGEQRTASNNTPSGRKSQVLPANINVNSSAPNTNRGNNTATEGRSGVAQENFNSNEDTNSTAENNGSSTESTTSVAQNNSPSDSFPSSDTTTDTSSSDNNQGNQPIRALW